MANDNPLSIPSPQGSAREDRASAGCGRADALSQFMTILANICVVMTNIPVVQEIRGDTARSASSSLVKDDTSKGSIGLEYNELAYSI